MTISDAILEVLQDLKRRRPLDQVPTLTIDEAAEYIGVSVSQFRDQAPIYGLKSRKVMGRVMYRRADLDQMIEALWLDTESAQRARPNTGNSRGSRPVSRAPRASVASTDSENLKSESSPGAKIVSLSSMSTPS
jgi:hypothetical protein